MKYLTAILIFGLTILNLVFPKNYFLYGLNYTSWLPIAVQLSWAAFCLIILIATPAHHSIHGSDRSKCMLLVLTGLGLLSLLFFQVEYASLQGDGAFGPPPFSGCANPLLYPAPDGRLAPCLSQTLSYFFNTSSSVFAYKYAWLQSTIQMADGWVLLTLLAGAAVILTTGLLALKSTDNAPKKTGVMLLVICSAPMLNFYGHFDSYAIPVLCVFGWFLCLQYIHRKKRLCRQDILLFLLMTFLAVWSHSSLLYLVFYGALYLTLRKAFRKITFGWTSVVLTSLLLGALPLFSQAARNPQLLQGAMIHWMLHEKISSLLLTACPALVMLSTFLFNMIRLRTSVRDPFTSTLLIISISTILTYFTLAAHLGFVDEFLYSIRGAILLGSVLLLCLHHGLPGRIFFCGGILSLFLFLPAVYVNSCDLLLKRYRSMAPYDHCVTSCTYSPYSNLALHIPVNTHEDRMLRLELLREGYSTTVPYWMKFKDYNRLFYTAWCYEFNQIEEGRKQLERAIQMREKAHLSFPLIDLWISGTRFTARYSNKAYLLIRTDCRSIINRELQTHPDDPYLNFLNHRLDYLEHPPIAHNP